MTVEVLVFLPVRFALLSSKNISAVGKLVKLEYFSSNLTVTVSNVYFWPLLSGLGSFILQE